MRASTSQSLGFALLFLCILFMLIFLGSVIYFVGISGARVITWDFLTQVPREAMTSGGVGPAIIGTFFLTVGAILCALPLGLACALYLTEYSPKSLAVNVIRIAISNLA